MGRSGIRFLHKEFHMQVRRWLLLPILVAAVTAGGLARADWKNVQVLPKTMSKDEGYLRYLRQVFGIEG